MLSSGLKKVLSGISNLRRFFNLKISLFNPNAGKCGSEKPRITYKLFLNYFRPMFSGSKNRSIGQKRFNLCKEAHDETASSKQKIISVNN